MIQSEIEWRVKHEEILKKFSPDFQVRLKTVPLYNCAFQSLLNDADPYKLIEFLLNTAYETQNTLTDYMVYNKNPDPIILSTQGWTEKDKEDFIKNWKEMSHENKLTVI
jgi:hypothetical protein